MSFYFFSLGLPLETVLNAFGQCWLRFCMDNGYEEMLRTLGGDFTSFVQNLDALHAHLARTYTELNYPSFRYGNYIVYNVDD